MRYLHNNPKSTGNAAGRHRPAFTLVEMLVVVSIIILLAAAGVPMVRALRGGRSIELANNLISALLARAHQQAITDNQYRGIFFYYDSTTDHSAMIMVQRQGESDPDIGFDAYKGWTGATAGPSVAYWLSPPNSFVQYPSYVVEPVTNAPGEPSNRLIVTKFQCISNVSSSGPDQPLMAAGNGNWGSGSSLYLEAMPLAETAYLPVGIGCRVITDPLGNAMPLPVPGGNPTGGNGTGGPFDRYMRTGVILFDATGRLDFQPWAVRQSSILGQILGLKNGDINDAAVMAATGISPPGTNEPILWSGFGLAVYQRDGFSTGQITQTETNSTTNYPAYNKQSVLTFTPSEGDYELHSPLLPGLGPQPSQSDKAGAEQWLDANASLLWIDRSTGAASKGF